MIDNPLKDVNWEKMNPFHHEDTANTTNTTVHKEGEEVQHGTVDNVDPSSKFAKIRIDREHVVYLNKVTDDEIIATEKRRIELKKELAALPTQGEVEAARVRKAKEEPEKTEAELAKNAREKREAEDE